MKRSLTLGALGGLALALGGCFATNPDPWNLPPDNFPPDGPPVVGGSLFVDDLAVDSNTGNIVSIGYDTNGYGQVVTVRDPDLNLLQTISLGDSVYGMSVTAPNSENQVLVSDGSYGEWLVDLDTGEIAPVTGMEEISNGPPAFLASGKYDDNAGDETFSVPCEFTGDDDMIVFGGEGDDRVLLARVGLAGSGLTGVTDITVDSTRGIVFALGYEGPVGLDANSGNRVFEFGDSYVGDISAWAYDAPNDRLIAVDYSGNLRAIALE